MLVLTFYLKTRSFSRKILLFSYEYVCICVSAGASKGQKTSNSWELELQTVVSRHVGAEYGNWVLWRSSP